MSATGTISPSILRYQRGRTLDHVSAYKFGFQLRLSGGQRVYLALSTTELVLYFHIGAGNGEEPDSEYAIHFDMEGRLASVAQPGQHWRRSLSNQMMFTRKLPHESGGGLQWLVLHPDDVDSLLSDTHTNTANVLAELESGAAIIEFAKPSVALARQQIDPLLRKAARFDTSAAQADARRFQSIYGRVAVLPPDQYNALVLQATQGCSHAGCVFCSLYRGVKYQPRTPSEFREHLTTAVAYHGQALKSRRSIFLGEANALSLLHNDLVAMFQILHEHFELPPSDQASVPASWWLGNEKRFDGVASFLDVFSGPPRSVEQLTELRRLGLRRLYIGVETGCDKLLQWLRKPATAESIGTWVRSVAEAGIHVGVIVLLGAGGDQFDEAHVRDTIRLLNQLPLGRGDFIYFSPLVVTNPGSYTSKAERSGVQNFTHAQMRAQEERIRAGLRFETNRGEPYLARYELETFIY